MATAQPQQPPQQQQFCVRWNSYQSNLQNAFPKLLTSEHFVDVTLACESEMIKCHKVVLSACSTYFEKLLVQNPCQHPIIFMKDMRFLEMQSLVDFMYKGEVNVTQDELPSLLRSAEALQIRGLCGSDQLLNQHYLGTLQAGAKTQTPTITTTQNGNDKTIQLQAQQPPQQQSHTTTPQQHSEEKNNSTEEQIEQQTVKSDIEGQPGPIRRDNSTEHSNDSTHNGSLSDDGFQAKLEQTMMIKDDYDNDDSYYDNDGELIMDSDYLDQDDEDPGQPGTSGMVQDSNKTPDFAIANVSCQYADGSPGGISGNRRIRRSEAELRRAAECITRGQTFQTVSDQFNIPISTIRFYMARKGILPRRKRGRACSIPTTQMSTTSMTTSGTMGSGGGYHNAPGNTSPIGPPYHIVHYKLPTLGAKLK